MPMSLLRRDIFGQRAIRRIRMAKPNRKSVKNNGFPGVGVCQETGSGSRIFRFTASGNWSTVKIGGELSGKDLIFLPADSLSSSVLPLILLRVFAHPYHHLPIRIYSKSQNGGIIVTIGCYNIF